MAIELPAGHFSRTQSGMFANCPAAYERRYVRGDKIAPGIALLTGSSVHTAAEENHRQKVQSHEDMQVSDLKDIAAETYDARIDDEDVYLLPEELPSAKRLIGEGKDRCVSLTGLYADECAPTVQPLEVEKRGSIELPGLCEVLYVLDVVDDANRVRDLKTTGNKGRFTQKAIAADEQLTMYALAYEVEHGIPPAGLQWNVLYNKNATFEYFARDTERTHDQFQALLNKLAVQVRAISAGYFPPTNRDNWWCNPKWCGYWWTCPYIPEREKKR